MTRLVGAAARALLAGVLFLLALAVLRWAPVHAAPPAPLHALPFAVRALPLAGVAVILATIAATAGAGPTRRWPVKRLALALAGVLVALGLVTAARRAPGLAARVSGPSGPLATLAPGPIDLAGRDLGALPAARKWTVEWEGALRVPASGVYRLWAEGRGRVEVRVDGGLVLEGDGERLRAAADVALGRGERRLQVRLERTGPGPRLRLGWTRPDGWSEAIPLRDLGPEAPWWTWAATDALAFAAALLLAGLALAAPWDARRRLPNPRPFTAPEVAWSALGHAVLFVLMSWPLVRDPARLGMTDRPDGRLNAWILAWGAHALLRAPDEVFQAPAFHPLPDALAFSENLLLPAAMAAPAQAGGPVLAYNLALAASAIASALGAQALARRAGAGALAAFVAGAAFGVGAHRWIRLAHLHAQVTLFLPLALAALDRFWQRRTLRRAVLVGLLVALQALSSVYLGAITAVAVAVAALVAIAAGLGFRDVLKLAAGALLAALLVAPVLRPYLRMRSFQGVEWTLEDVAVYATTLESYAASGTRLYGRLTQRHLDPERVQDTLFPGLTLLALGIAGLASAPARYRVVAIAASAAAVILSLGPETALYRFLHENVVLFRGVRALSRFSLIPVLALSVLAACALTGRRRLALPALALLLVESSNVPIRYAFYEGPPPVARWLAGREGAVVVLPLGEDDTRVMLDVIAHFRPLVNGDSGFVPRPYTRASELLQLPLAAEGLRFLRAVGVRDVVAREPIDLPVAAELGQERVHEVPPGEPAHRVSPGRAVPALWSADGARIDLAAPEEIGRVVFTVGEEPWVDTPRVWVSLDGERWEEARARASLADAALSLYADPRAGRGEVRFPPRRARHLRLDPRLPARTGTLEIGG